MDLLPRKSGPAQVAAGGTPRVNLLPREVVERRAQRTILKNWGFRLLGAVVVVGVVCVLLFAWQAIAALRLSAVQADGQALLTQIAAKSEIGELLNREQELTGFRAEARSTDLSWERTIDRIREALPDDGWVCAYELRSGAEPSGDPETGVGFVGTVTVCGPFPAGSAFMGDILSVKGVASATVLEGSWDDEIDAYAHTVEIAFDQTVYAGHDDEEAGE
ncbi:hypothetical protein J4H92_04020 [Leucobacter weissii]|uniref:Uncharacterized protein n=1 Tax=Leucobacter weissii TaxID=1983706 RepID=A0A939MQD4_9MICO|nr:hypothetical protein [Leucobacter weissii]MBO1901114.1 hypothetical protein [Leucobacter weissii]